MATTANQSATASPACHNKSSRPNGGQPPDLVDEDNGAGDPVLTLVVRSDATGGTDPARVQARCCSATLATYWAERDNAKVDIGVEWTKRVLVCDDDAALDKLASRARACGIRAREFRDKETGERSLLALGPGVGWALAMVTDGSLVRTIASNWRVGEGEGGKMRAETLRVLAQVMEYRSPTTKKKLKPNDKCDCGSGLKFKKCCARKTGDAALEDAVLAVLGDEAVAVLTLSQTFGKDSSEDQDNSKINVVQGGEKVPGFRKQVEYGAKKYIKP